MSPFPLAVRYTRDLGTEHVPHVSKQMSKKTVRGALAHADDVGCKLALGYIHAASHRIKTAVGNAGRLALTAATVKTVR